MSREVAAVLTVLTNFCTNCHVLQHLQNLSTSPDKEESVVLRRIWSWIRIWWPSWRTWSWWIWIWLSLNGLLEYQRGIWTTQTSPVKDMKYGDLHFSWKSGDIFSRLPTNKPPGKPSHYHHHHPLHHIYCLVIYYLSSPTLQSLRMFVSSWLRVVVNSTFSPSSFIIVITTSSWHHVVLCRVFHCPYVVACLPFSLSLCPTFFAICYLLCLSCFVACPLSLFFLPSFPSNAFCLLLSRVCLNVMWCMRTPPVIPLDFPRLFNVPYCQSSCPSCPVPVAFTLTYFLSCLAFLSCLRCSCSWTFTVVPPPPQMSCILYIITHQVPHTCYSHRCWLTNSSSYCNHWIIFWHIKKKRDDN